MYKNVLTALMCVLFVGVASAGVSTNDVQIYGATFEGTANPPVNDFGYESGTAATLYAGDGYGWFAGEDDGSEIATDGGNQYLDVDSGASVLTNRFSDSVKTAVNGAMAAGTNSGTSQCETNALAAYIAATAKFVPSDTLSPGYEGGTDSSKFAIYAYCGGASGATNVVLYHAWNSGSGIVYTNEVFESVPVDCSAFVPVRAEMKNQGGYNLVSVKVGGVQLASILADDADGDTPGIWFRTTEIAGQHEVTCVNFKGNGKVDNLAVGSVAEEIARIAIPVPAAAANLVYSGSEQTGVSAGTGYTVTSGGTGTNAGDYEAILTLDDGYVWSDGSLAPTNVAWSIAKAAVAVPTAVENLVYSGTEQTGVVAGTGYTIDGNTATAAGDYTATATLASNNYKWSDDTTAAKSNNWSIARKSVTVTADNASKSVGQADPASFSATVSGTIGADTVAYTVSRVAGEAVGTYAITPTGAAEQGNYAVSYVAGTFTINNAYFTVTWKNGDVTLETDTNVEYGATPTYDGATPTRDSTDTTVYTFSGWSPAVGAITADTIYTAQFSESVRKYTITWEANGGTLSGDYTSGSVDYGTAIVAPTATKAEDAQYTYEFIGWTPELEDNATVVSNATYTAQYSATEKVATVISIALDTNAVDNVRNGTLAAASASGRAVTVKAAVAQSAGISPAGVLANGEAVAVSGGIATATFNTNWNSAVDWTIAPASGDADPLVGKTYAKAEDAWFAESELGAVTDFGDKVGVGVAPSSPSRGSEAVRIQMKLEVASCDELPSVVGLSRGGIVVYDGKYRAYTGEGWLELAGAVPVEGSEIDLLVVADMASQSPSVRYYVDGVSLYATNGTDRVYAIAIPGESRSLVAVGVSDTNLVKSAIVAEQDVSYVGAVGDAGFTTEVGLTNAIAAALTTGDSVAVTLLANVSASIEIPVGKSVTLVTNEYAGLEFTAPDGYAVVPGQGGTYSVAHLWTVAYEDYDGTLLASLEGVVDGAATPAYPNATPTRAATAQYTYEFSGWTPTPDATVSSNSTYTATYSSTVNQYTISWNANGGELSGSYTSGLVDYGTTIVAPTATKAEDAQYIYEFIGWTPTPDATVVSNAAYTAQYSATEKVATVISVALDTNAVDNVRNGTLAAVSTSNRTVTVRAAVGASDGSGEIAVTASAGGNSWNVVPADGFASAMFSAGWNEYVDWTISGGEAEPLKGRTYAKPEAQWFAAPAAETQGLGLGTFPAGVKPDAGSAAGESVRIHMRIEITRDGDSEDPDPEDIGDGRGGITVVNGAYKAFNGTSWVGLAGADPVDGEIDLLMVADFDNGVPTMRYYVDGVALYATNGAERVYAVPLKPVEGDANLRLSAVGVSDAEIVKSDIVAEQDVSYIGAVGDAAFTTVDGLIGAITAALANADSVSVTLFTAISGGGFAIPTGKTVTINGTWSDLTVVTDDGSFVTATTEGGSTTYSSSVARATVITVADAGATTNVVGTYASLREAIGAATAGSIAVLLADDRVSFAAPDATELAVSKAMTIDGAGHTLYGLSAYAPPSDGTADHDMFVSGSGDIVIRNLTLDGFGDGVAVNQRTYPIWVGQSYTGTLELENVVVTNFNRTAFNFNGGTIVVDGCAIYGDIARTSVEGNYFQSGMCVYGASVTVANTTIVGVGAHHETDETSRDAGCFEVASFGDNPAASGSIVVLGGAYSGQHVALVGSNVTSAAGVIIRGGSFAGALSVDDGSEGGVVVEGGTFDRQVPAEFAGAGLAPTTIADANGEYTVRAARTVAFEVDGNSYTNLVVADGEPVARPADPEKNLYGFRAWQLNEADYDFETLVTADITLVADWTRNLVTLTVPAVANATVSATTNDVELVGTAGENGTTVYTVEAGTAVDVVYTANTGYHVTGSESTTRTYPISAGVMANNFTLDASATTMTICRYTVTWETDGGVLAGDYTAGEVDYGTAIVPPASVTKAASAQYAYAFAGWTPSPIDETVTSNVTYTATYTASTRQYTVTFVDEDGETVLKEATAYDYGTAADAIVKPDDPTKESTTSQTFEFAGWSPAVAEVTSNATYTATYTASTRQYTVTFVDEDGETVLKEATAYDYGTAADDIVKPDDPTKESTASQTFEFAGWSPAVAEVTSNATYTATYTASVRTYTITWVVDGVETTTQVAWHETPAYSGTPSKAEDEQNTYTFAGWNPEIAIVTGEATYTAQFTPVPKEATVISVALDTNAVDNVRNGTLAATGVSGKSVVVRAAVDKTSGTGSPTVTARAGQQEQVLTPDDGIVTATFAANWNQPVEWSISGGTASPLSGKTYLKAETEWFTRAPDQLGEVGGFGEAASTGVAPANSTAVGESVRIHARLEASALGYDEAPSVEDVGDARGGIVIVNGKYTAFNGTGWVTLNGVEPKDGEVDVMLVCDFEGGVQTIRYYIDGVALYAGSAESPTYAIAMKSGDSCVAAVAVSDAERVKGAVSAEYDVDYRVASGTTAYVDDAAAIAAADKTGATVLELLASGVVGTISLDSTNETVKVANTNNFASGSGVVAGEGLELRSEEADGAVVYTVVEAVPAVVHRATAENGIAILAKDDTENVNEVEFKFTAISVNGNVVNVSFEAAVYIPNGASTTVTMPILYKTDLTSASYCTEPALTASLEVTNGGGTGSVTLPGAVNGQKLFFFGFGDATVQQH